MKQRQKKDPRIPWKKKHKAASIHSYKHRSRKFRAMLRRLYCKPRRITLFEYIMLRFCPGVLF